MIDLLLFLLDCLAIKAISQTRKCECCGGEFAEGVVWCGSFFCEPCFEKLQDES